MNNDSYVPVDAQVLAAACSAVIARIEARRAAQTKEYVLDRVGDIWGSPWHEFWRRILGRPLPTYEQVLAAETEAAASESLSGYRHPLSVIKYRYETQYEVAKKLLRIAHVQSRFPVYVSASDLVYVADFMP